MSTYLESRILLNRPIFFWKIHTFAASLKIPHLLYSKKHSEHDPMMMTAGKAAEAAWKLPDLRKRSLWKGQANVNLYLWRFPYMG